MAVCGVSSLAILAPAVASKVPVWATPVKDIPYPQASVKIGAPAVLKFATIVLAPVEGAGKYQILAEKLAVSLSCSFASVIPTELYVTEVTVLSESVPSCIATATTKTRLEPVEVWLHVIESILSSQVLL